MIVPQETGGKTEAVSARILKIVAVGASVVALLLVLASIDNRTPTNGKTPLLSEVELATKSCIATLKKTATLHDGFALTASKNYNIDPQGVLAFYGKHGELKTTRLDVKNAASEGVLDKLTGVAQAMKEEHRLIVSGDVLLYLTKDNTVVTVSSSVCRITGVYLPQSSGSLNGLISPRLTGVPQLHRKTRNAESGSEFDVLIVGGGVAGLYINYELHENDAGLSVLQVERLGRIGGRFFSSEVSIDDGLEHFQIENGGMRFYPDFHLRLHGLLSKLGLCGNIAQFSLPPGAQDVFYLRDTLLNKIDPYEDFVVYLNNLYQLSNWEQTHPQNLTEQLFDRILREGSGCFPPQNGSEWQRFGVSCSYDGTDMNNWGFRTLLTTLALSAEGFAVTEDLGFGSFYKDEESAASGFEHTVSSHTNKEDRGTQYALQGGGMGLIPKRLAAWLELRHDQVPQLNTLVTGLEYEGGDTNKYKVTAQIDGDTEVEYYANRVVLTLSPAQLHALNSPLLDTQEHEDLIDSAHLVPLTKINLIWKNKWWTNGEDGLTGASTSSDELGSVYVNHLWQSESGPAAAMTIYCDDVCNSFWHDAFEAGDTYVWSSGVQITSIDNKEGMNLRASNEMVTFALEKLGNMFPGSSPIPPPDAATYSPWGTDMTYGSAVHSWTQGTNSIDVMDSIWNLDSSTGQAGGISVANEAYSDNHGWVEGAIMSAENVLRNVFGISVDISEEPQCDVPPPISTDYQAYFEPALP